jgi:hypothetical protein
MSPDPDSVDLPTLDVSPARAERIRRRGQRALARWADPFAQTWLGRVERTWIDRLEPFAAGVGGAALVLWAFGLVFA